MPKTVAFDLDDTLCVRDEGLPVEKVIGSDKYEGCEPIPAMIKIMNACYDAGYRVVILTSRGMGQFKGDAKQCDRELREVTTRKLEGWGAKYHHLVFGKIHYDLLVDDKVENSSNIGGLDDIWDIVGDP